MSSLLTLDNAELALGMHPLLDHARLTVAGGERIGLIGRNGSGKSSLLRVLAEITPLDGGELQWSGEHRVVLVEQEPILAPAKSLRESLEIRGDFNDVADERDRWRLQARLDEYLHRFQIDGGLNPQDLSGGETKRAALALAFALQADLLLLDEPTNHLDIDGILLLEELMQRVPTAILISHDRAFLDRLVSRIVELDRGLLRSYPGNFADYERRKAAQLIEEAVHNRKFDKFWAQEEVWIRQGIKARRTRDEGRVRRLEQLRADRSARRERLGKVHMRLDAGERSGKLVAELEKVRLCFDDLVIVEQLTMRIQSGDRLALIGPNGAGKSTLLRLILGELAPDSGSVRLGSNLQIAYFDQLRDQLDLDATVANTISPGSEWVEFGGKRKHVISYLGDFLFPPQRANTPVKGLSGGERNRLLLARLFARPANLLVLDEPTNDLDIESLELLEATLQSYQGTLLLVSHDRVFLDNIVTQTLVAEGGGHWQEYVGGYTDYLAQRAASEAGSNKPIKQAKPKQSPSGKTRRKERQRFSYQETREMAQLPAEIEALEREQQALISRMSEADYHRQDIAVLQADKRRAEEIPHLLEEKFLRWAEFEERSN